MLFTYLASLPDGWSCHVMPTWKEMVVSLFGSQPVIRDPCILGSSTWAATASYANNTSVEATSNAAQRFLSVSVVVDDKIDRYIFVFINYYHHSNIL